jgi:hypothetical protein
MPAAQMIDELVAGQGIRPGREGQRAVVAVALQMHGKECLLNEILDFGARAADAAAEIAPQITAQDAEELAVRARVPLQTADHQRPEALFSLVLLLHWGATHSRCATGVILTEKRSRL